MDPKILNETLPVLSRNWEIETMPGDPGSNETFVLALLESRIEEMLKSEMGTLVNAMYRLDIHEGLFHQAMALPSGKEKAQALARLVLDREYQKAESRLKYKQG